MPEEKISEERLKSLCEQSLYDARIFNSEIQTERQQNLNRYTGEPIGDEREGSSQFQTTDVHDVVEGIMPYMIENCLSKESVAFAPKNAEDVDQAQLETAYVRHVVFEQNPGFLIGETWMKDALIQKTGIVKAFWDEVVREEKETYEGLNFLAYQKILMDDAVDIKAKTVYLGEEEVDEEELLQHHLPFTTYDLDVKRKENQSQVRLISIPPENFFIERNYTGLDLNSNPGCDFCAHLEERTVSDLLQDGYSIEQINRIPDADTEYVEEERVNRYSDEGGVIGQPYSYDANRRVYVAECYMRVDFDNDGFAELRKITVGGTKATILLDNEEVDRIPFHILCPEPLPHRFYGMCPADRTRHIQLVKTSLIRQINDNIYLTNNPRKKVLTGSVENIDQLLESRVGGVILVNRPDAITDDVTPFVARESLDVMALYDQMREERTGWSRAFAGLDIEAFNDNTIYGVSKMMGAAQARQGMYVRRFLEGGFKTLYLHVQELLQKFEKEEKMFRYKGDFVEIDPRSWRKRTDVDVLVGVGNASDETRLAHYKAIAGEIKTIIELQGGGEGPLVGLDNVYNLAEDTIEAMGMAGTPDRYIRDPADYQPPPPQPDPAAQAMQAAMEVENKKVEATNNRTKADVAKHQQSMALEKEKFESQDAIDRQKNETDALLTREKMQQDEELKRLDMASKTHTALFKEQVNMAQGLVGGLFKYAESETRSAPETPDDGVNNQLMQDIYELATAKNTEISEALTRATILISDSQKEFSKEQVNALGVISGGLEGTITELRGLAEYVSKPKRPVYDDDGNVIRVEVMDGQVQ